MSVRESHPTLGPEYLLRPFSGWRVVHRNGGLFAVFKQCVGIAPCCLGRATGCVNAPRLIDASRDLLDPERPNVQILLVHSKMMTDRRFRPGPVDPSCSSGSGLTWASVLSLEGCRDAVRSPFGSRQELDAARKRLAGRMGTDAAVRADGTPPRRTPAHTTPSAACGLPEGQANAP